MENGFMHHPEGLYYGIDTSESKSKIEYIEHILMEAGIMKAPEPYVHKREEFLMCDEDGAAIVTSDGYCAKLNNEDDEIEWVNHSE
jgi:hypothetical protein